MLRSLSGFQDKRGHPSAELGVSAFGVFATYSGTLEKQSLALYSRLSLLACESLPFDQDVAPFAGIPVSEDCSSTSPLPGFRAACTVHPRAFSVDVVAEGRFFSRVKESFKPTRLSCFDKRAIVPNQRERWYSELANIPRCVRSQPQGLYPSQELRPWGTKFFLHLKILLLTGAHVNYTVQEAYDDIRNGEYGREAIR